MASCYLCGSQIPKGQALRKHVYTGLSIGGFSLFSNVFLDWIMNTGIRRRFAPVRSFYAVKTICGHCAASRAAADKQKLFVLLVIVSSCVSLVLGATIIATFSAR
jgi:hypothetical protein